MSSLLTLLVLLSLHGAASGGERIFTARTGPISVTNAAHEPKYMVTYIYNDKSNRPLDPRDLNNNTVVMTKKDGQKFLCTLPSPPSEDKDNEAGDLTAEEDRRGSLSGGVKAQEKHRQRTPEELLEDLNTCFYRIEGWWAYEFCYKKHIRQYHQEKDQVVAEFLLGKYDAAATAELNAEVGELVQKDPRSLSADQRYYAQVYTNGTACDLNNEIRQTEVRFLCAEEQSYLSAIKEPATCRYVVNFHTPLICRHPLYRLEEQPWNVIQCEAIGNKPSEGVMSEATKVDSEVAVHKLRAEAEGVDLQQHETQQPSEAALHKEL